MTNEYTAKIAHLEMIQAVITRLATNSFRLKQWTVLLLAAFIGAGAASESREFSVLAILPLVAFWLLDAYYLHQERLFRALYDNVRSRLANEIDFDMRVPLDAGVAPFRKVVTSRTILGFYAPLAIALLIAVGFG